MCEQCHSCSNFSGEYNEFPPQIIGGPTGDYFLDCPVRSSEWTEYRIVAISVGDAAGASTAVISGFGKPFSVPFDGSATLTDNAFRYGIVYRFSPTTTPPVIPTWIKIANQEKRVYVRIDTQNATSVILSIQFRDKIIKTIPGPFVAVHPEHMEQYNQERERRIKMQVLGNEGEIEEYSPRVVQRRIIRPIP